MAINREEITDVIFQGTRTPANDFTSPVIDGWSEDILGRRGARVQRRRGEGAVGRGRRDLARGPAPSRSPTTPTAATRPGSTLWRTASRTRWASTRRALRTRRSPRLRTAITDRTIQTAFRTGWQADYPALFNFLGPLYATGAGSNDGDYSNPEFDALLKEGLARDRPR